MKNLLLIQKLILYIGCFSSITYLFDHQITIMDWVEATITSTIIVVLSEYYKRKKEIKEI